MVNKKKGMPLPKRDLQTCQDLYEKAMLAAEKDKPEDFKRHMTSAISESEKLLEACKNGQPGEDSQEDLTEFVAQCCFELGTFLQEAYDFGNSDFLETDDGEGTASTKNQVWAEDREEIESARRARPYLERAVDLYRGHADIARSFCRPAVISLSTLYAVLHEHDKDIELCQEFVGRLIKQYNQWTPLQNDVLAALAGAFNNAGQLDEAEKTYKEILSICKTNFGDTDDRTKEAEAELNEYLEDRQFGVCICKSRK